MTLAEDFARFERTQPDPRDIRAGVGRVPWGSLCQANATDGWVLPGGERTADRERAERVARSIDAITLAALAVGRFRNH